MEHVSSSSHAAPSQMPWHGLLTVTSARHLDSPSTMGTWAADCRVYGEVGARDHTTPCISEELGRAEAEQKPPTNPVGSHLALLQSCVNLPPRK